ncbi:MAG: hypothetical protein R6T99_03565 [Bacteroidales bacterium]
MMRFNMDHFNKLAAIHNPHCISIFIPTHRGGQEVNKKVDARNLKNQLKKAENDLEGYGLKPQEINQLLRPVRDLLDDDHFWTKQSDGLAIFRSEDHMEFYSVPVYFEEYVYVSDHYYLKPLVPIINENERFYLLAISLKSIRFYEGFPHQIDEIEIDDLVPQRLEEVVGFDYRQKYLQYRSGQSAFNKSMYHGQGEGKDDEKEEIMKFLRAVNDGLMKYLHNRTAPLLLAAVDYLIPMYEEVNDYNNLHDEHLTGNPEEEDPVLMHEKSMDILEGHFKKVRNEKKKMFEQALSNNVASYEESEIIPAAVNGRIDTLFVRNREEMYGIFEKETNSIRTDEKKTAANADLLNLAVVKTIQTGGNAFLIDGDEMPEKAHKLNAIFRWTTK